jgi:hypothetical protein
MGGSRGEYEQLFTALGPCLGLNILEQCIAAPRASVFGMHGEAGKFGCVVVWKWIEGGTADYHAVMLNDNEPLYLHFQQFAIAPDQCSIGFQRSYQL